MGCNHSSANRPGNPPPPPLPPRPTSNAVSPRTLPSIINFTLAIINLLTPSLHAQSTLDTIGLTTLRAQNPALTGSGVFISQVESAPIPAQFEVNPGSPGHENVRGLFTYRSTLGLSATFPNPVGSESTHADSVAEALYGANTGVAPALLHVSNFETDFFYANVILPLIPTRAIIVNQSFEFGSHSITQDDAYDNYIALWHTIIASGVGNGGPILSPADSYNGIGVAAFGGSSSVGPAADGRSKPDITAPGGATSFSTPLVSGAAALLVQSGRTQGINAAAAIDSRTIKALLLTGATKPSGWSHTYLSPLDPRYGAGILNVFNSWTELSGGRHAPIAVNLSNATHPPRTDLPAQPFPQGWDYRASISTPSADAVSHYRIATSATAALVTTLVWNKGRDATRLNQLTLFLYDSTGNLLASSRSPIDNIQHLYVPNLAPGSYEIEVVKKAGPYNTPGVASGREIYALAWDFDR